MFSAPLLFRAHFSIPAFLFGGSDLVMLIWADGFLVWFVGVGLSGAGMWMRAWG